MYNTVVLLQYARSVYINNVTVLAEHISRIEIKMKTNPSVIHTNRKTVLFIGFMWLSVLFMKLIRLYINNV